MQKFKISFTILILFLSYLLNAQNGFIRGTIFDDNTGETLPGINVIVEGTTSGSVTDFDGNFNLNIEPGIYTLKISFISYETVVISNVEVKSKEVTLLENLRLKEARIELAEVTITAKEVRNTESALNTIKMKSVNVMDGISAFTLKRIGDSDAASSMKRVPGVSVEGGKYVYVRGLGDRYTKTTLNGTDIPGLDPDRNTLQIDIFPTSVIDNLIVHKSFSAELPADFTGGIINIELKDFPEERKGNISIGTAYNPDSHFKSEFLTYKGGKTDFMGFDDGTRSIPATENIPNFSQAVIDANGTIGNRYKEVLGNFNPNMAAIKEKNLMDYSFGLSYGNQHPLKKITIGYNFALSYKNLTDFYNDIEYGRYRLIPVDNENPFQFDRLYHQTGDLGVNNVFLGALGGLALKTKNSKFRVYLLHLRNGESSAGILNIESTDVGSEWQGYQNTLEYSQRSLTNILIEGKHVFDDGKWTIEWKFSPTVSKLEDPDIRLARYEVDNGDTSITSECGFPERIWRNLEETNLGGVLHFTKEFSLNNQKAKLKFGGAYTSKERSYSLRKFAIKIQNWGGDYTGNPDELFSQENLWPKNGNLSAGTYFDQSFYPENSNQYDASVSYFAGYSSLELGLLKKLKAVIGLRYENYIQNYTGQNQLGDLVLDNEKVLDNSDFFPAVNFIYSLTEKQNLRFSYSKTIARPSMKELSFAEIVDAISGITFIGSMHPQSDTDQGITYWDGNLVSTYIQNFDLRWELFQAGGNMVSISSFYKQFTDPIEMVQYTVTQKTSIQARNVGDGQVFGAELEFRQSLGLISDAMQNFGLMLNFTYVKSRIKMSDTEYETRLVNARPGQTIDNYRDMAGQSPYLVNAGISYNGGATGFWKGFEAGFYYNVQGSTLQIVGISNLPDIYAEPFHSLNFNSSKVLGKKERLQIGFKIDNILNSKKLQIYKAYNTPGQYYRYLNQGTSFELKIGYNF